jgi:hypothetical protein
MPIAKPERRQVYDYLTYADAAAVFGGPESFFEALVETGEIGSSASGALTFIFTWELLWWWLDTDPNYRPFEWPDDIDIPLGIDRLGREVG